MNTIFLEIVKRYLVSAIDAIIKQSIDADNTALAQTRELLGVPRDKILSETKRENLRLLKNKLLDYKPESAKDDFSMREFMGFIKVYQNDIAVILRAKNMSPGDTDKAIAKALEFTQSVYTQFERAMLLETPHDQHPFRIFKYYMGHYFALKIIEQQNISSIQDATEHPSVSNYRARATRRETLIIEAIRVCAEELAAMKDGSQQMSILKRFVMDRIALLEQADKTLRQEYGMTLSFTTSILNSFNLTNTDDTILIDQLNEARRGIQEKTEEEDDWQNIGTDQTIRVAPRLAPSDEAVVKVSPATRDTLFDDLVKEEDSTRNAITTEEDILIQEALLKYSFLREQQKGREAISLQKDQEKPNPTEVKATPSASSRKKR